MHNDSTYCDYIEFMRHIPPLSSQPDERVLQQRDHNCLRMDLPNAFSYLKPANLVWSKNSAMSFYLHAYRDIDFRVEIQILNGVYLTDRFMMLGSCAVEIEAPRRMNYSTTSTYIIELNMKQELELPYNMPLKSIETGSAQEVLSKAWLNFLPTWTYSWDAEACAGQVAPCRIPTP